MFGPQVLYHPRSVSDLGNWESQSLTIKAYGLTADGQALGSDAINTAKRFIDDDVTKRVAQMDDSNTLGFVIVHVGDLGTTIAAHWWVQGSVLCQHIFRQLHDDAAPMDTVTRPVIGCVWELALINAEQEAWRKHMMTPAPDRAGYIAERPPFHQV